MRVTETKFFAVLRPGKISEVDAFELLKQAMGLAGIWDRQKANDFEKAKKKIQKRGTDVLPIALASIEFDFARVNHKQLDWVSLVSAELTPEFCGTFARELSRTSLVMAAVLDRDYDYWQNAEDTLQYKAAGRSHAHLPMKSNGLPPPLTQDAIDISSNPGRRIVKIGFFEIVGYLMWFTDVFWNLAGVDKAAMYSVSECTITEEAPGLMRVQAGNKFFSSAEGEEARLQNRLREVLFGKR
ncbi:MAG: hypothetical protein DME23_03390 [Verrucomicrobia bacterium]|nr:MAG: hypothetical protein DME23_03390 [Verrucomicrobiota bacterium]